MGILNEMFGSGDEDIQTRAGELLADGEYESHAEEILKGYKVYQKKYVYSSMVWKMLIVALALTSSVLMIINSESGDVVPFFCLMLSVFVGIWFISVPVTNAKNLKKGLDSLEGVKYRAEIFTDKIKISTCETPSAENTGQRERSEQSEQSETDIIALEGESEEIPATIIHLDSPIVDFIEKEDMFILVVKKAYVFIIPKSAFKDGENENIREKLSLIMGIRYKDLI